MDRAKSLYVSIHGSENGFEAAFSPGTNVANMTAEQLMERLSFSTPFQVDDHLKPPEFYSQKLIDTFEKMLEECIIETVDNGEFDTCASKLLECLDMQDDISYTRPPALVLERCRRGGKTFMLSAASETAVNAIYSRIAYFIANPAGEFHIFRKKYSTFDSIREWLYINEVILLVDELNVIPNNATGYDDIGFQLDTHVSKKGGALLYSTHHRIENDLLRGRQLGPASKLSLRKHLWMKIPRIDTESCLVQKGKFKFGFWSAVLRGRIPALVCLPNYEIADYTPNEENMFTERQHAMGAVLTGRASGLEVGRDLFRSYCYREGNYLLWPPFLIAQSAVLGKEVSALRDILEHSDMSEPKAFEALVELAVIVRLLSHSENRHEFVPRHRLVSNDNSFQATEIIHVHQKHKDIASLVGEVERAFPRSTSGRVLHVVAIPLYDQFPKYDFFLLHRGRYRGWSIQVGYQCKMGRKYPVKKHRAESRRIVSKSVWIEGMGPDSRTNTDDSHGWTLMTKDDLQAFLGVSLFHALPQLHFDESSIVGV